MPVRRAFSRAAIRAASREGANRRPARLARPRASGGRPAALHVTDDTGRHLRYTSRAKREADVSLSHRCTMEHPVAPWSTRRRVLLPRDRRFEALLHRRAALADALQVT